ncbi:MAG: hypothetical protein ACETWG_06515 [Candidatus Neomarinimicrobiota bacterium]
MRSGSVLPWVFLGIIIGMCFYGCSEPEVETPRYEASPLEQAYQEQSDPLLGKFFENWQQGIPHISDQELSQLSAAKRAIFEVFTKFYNPFNLSATGGSEWGDSLYAGIRYAVIQNRVDFGFVRNNLPDSLWIYSYLTPEVEDSILNFRPQTLFSNAPSIYYSQKYQDIITAFIGDTAEVWERVDFLNRYIRIIPGHWFGWHVETHPLASFILIDYALEHAKVYYQIVYQGGFAYLTKQNGHWTIAHAQLTWIM